MITFWSSGDLNDQLRLANSIRRELATFHVEVVRVKVECATADLSRIDLPAGESHYFETHLKLLLKNDAEVERTRQLSRSTNARLSRNARRVRSDGAVERFMTQRVYSHDLAEADRRREELIANVRRTGIEILEIEAEYVLYDSKLELDRGWL